METSENSYLKLISEFSELNLEYRVSEISYLSAIDSNPDNLETFYQYQLIFQHDYIVPYISSEQFEMLEQYSKYVDHLRTSFYRMINGLIETEGIDAFTYNQINDYKIHFQEIRSLYQQDEITKCWIHLRKKESISSLSDISYSQICLNDVLFFIQASIRIQIEAIDQIITFLNEKLSILELYKEHNKSKRHQLSSKAIITPTKLDKYQTSLLFDYLAKIGVIHNLSYNLISRIVSELTNHSYQNLRTVCFNHLWEIKSGKIGNKDFIKNNPSHNLEKTREIFLELLHEVNNDIEKNKEFNTKMGE